MTNDIMALVGAAFGRLIEQGLSVDEQDRDDVLQAGYAGALEAAARWVPELGAFSTFITACVRGEMLKHVNEEARGGIGSRESEPLTRYGDGDVTDIDALTGETEPLIARQTYDFTPKGFDPEVETEAMLLQRNVTKLPEDERRFIEAAFGLRGHALTAGEIAEQSDVSLRTVWRRLNSAMARLGYRESVAPEGWAEYRETAFRKGAGATKASQPTGVLAAKPYRRGRNDLYDATEARSTRASNKRAWLTAGRQRNGLPR